MDIEELRELSSKLEMQRQQSQQQCNRFADSFLRKFAAYLGCDKCVVPYNVSKGYQWEGDPPSIRGALILTGDRYFQLGVAIELETHPQFGVTKWSETAIKFRRKREEDFIVQPRYIDQQFHVKGDEGWHKCFDAITDELGSMYREELNQETYPTKQHGKSGRAIGFKMDGE